eukprot:357292-Chlamydomonas_euryale.AAC.5
MQVQCAWSTFIAVLVAHSYQSRALTPGAQTALRATALAESRAVLPQESQFSRQLLSEQSYCKTALRPSESALKPQCRRPTVSAIAQVGARPLSCRSQSAQLWQDVV